MRILICSYILLIGFVFGPVVCLGHAGTNDIMILNSRWPDSSNMEAFARDAVRIMGAETDQEKVLAVFRFLRMFTTSTDGNVPREPALGDNYIDDPLKVLNVYGAHHCDGLTRILERAWRSLGYRAEKLYRSGHTQADLHYQDRDGKWRWHLFDPSQAWFAYHRSGQRMASADDIASDFSLIFRPPKGPRPSRPHYWGMWNWVHAPHVDKPEYSSDLSLRRGEKATFYWQPLDKPYQDNFRKKGKQDLEHGPYPVTYANAEFIYQPISRDSWFADDAYVEPVNLIRDNAEHIASVVPERSGQTAELVYRIKYPYIISDASLSGVFQRRNEHDGLSVMISADQGESWHQVWEAEDTGRIELDNLDICKEFDIYSGNESMQGTPFGRYEYLVKLVLLAGDTHHSVGINSLELRTTVQHNMFALPQLWPGENLIRVQGESEQGLGLRVSYAWEDSLGRNRQHTVWVGDPPYEYRILAAGSEWEDVRCKTLSIAVKKGAMENKVLQQEKSPLKLHRPGPAQAFSMQEVLGNKEPNSLKSTKSYIQDLQSSQKQVQALAGLMVLRDKQAYDAVLKVALESKRFPQKDMAVQALNLVDPQRAKSDLLAILEKDARVTLKQNPENQNVELGHWYNLSALAGHILAESREESAVEPLIRVLKSIVEHEQTSWEPHASIIRSLGRLGDPAAAPAIRPFLDRNVDVAARAVQALGRLGDTESAPEIRALFLDSEYDVLKAEAAIALGRLGDKSVLPQMQAMLDSQDENQRAAAARALGLLAGAEARGSLQQALEQESFPWVREIIQNSLERMEEEPGDT
ncbi:MAG: HEAT repeat domain-containing protein [Desulfohalobiaceae bacterium]